MFLRSAFNMQRSGAQSSTQGRINERSSFLTGMAAGVAAAAGTAGVLAVIRQAYSKWQAAAKNEATPCSGSKSKHAAPSAGSEFPEYTTVDAESLRTFAMECLRDAGCAWSNAELVADVLLSVSGCSEMRCVASCIAWWWRLVCLFVGWGTRNSSSSQSLHFLG